MSIVNMELAELKMDVSELIRADSRAANITPLSPVEYSLERNTALCFVSFQHKQFVTTAIMDDLRPLVARNW